MKTIIITLIMSMFLINVFAGSSDSTEILRQCLNLEELQTFFQKQENDNLKTIVLMKREVVFPDSFLIQNSTLPIVQMSRDQIVNESIETFLMFQKFEITDGFAFVKLGLLHGAIKNPQLVEVMLEFKKTKEKWEIFKIMII